MEIEYVTHASLRLLAGGSTLLLDPFYVLDDATAAWLLHYPPRSIDLARLGAIDWLYSSHIHPDHSHPRTLELLRGQVGQVLLPAERPALRARYERLGYRDIRLLENGRTVALAPDLEVTSFWSDPIDSVLVIQSGGTVVVHQNDCLLAPATAARIGDRFRVDYLFVLYTAAQSLFPLLLDRPPLELIALTRGREADSLRDNLAVIDAMRPATVVPYSMTLTYFAPDQLHINGYGRLVPQEFCERLRAARPGVRSLVMHPGDVLDAASGSLARGGGTDAWGATLAEYLANVGAYARAHAHELPRFFAGDPAAVAPRVLDYLRARLQAAPLPDLFAAKTIVLQLTGDAPAPRITLEVDADGRAVAAGPPRRRPWLEITLPASLADIVVSGAHDPFTPLHSHRIRFRLHGAHGLSPIDEVTLYVVAFVFLFSPGAFEEFLGRSAETLARLARIIHGDIERDR